MLFQLMQSIREGKFPIPLPFCSLQTLYGLDDTHPHQERPSALLSLMIHMLDSSGNTLTDVPRYTV